MSKKRSESTSSDSHRWSRASSDSDASFISNPAGDLCLDRVRASDVKDLLESLAQITGGRDKRGFLFISILKDATEEGVSLDDLKKVILYLSTTRSAEEREFGFSFLVCLKATPPYGTIRPLAKVLQDHFPYKVIHLYVVKPEGYKEKLLSTSLSSSKYKFEVSVVNKENLLKHIALDELADEFGGYRKYEHSVWFKMRLAFEKFLFESMALSSKLDEIKRSLLQDDFAATVDGVRDQLQHHQHVRKWIIKAPIEVLAEEAQKVINTIKSSCDCPSEDDLKDEYQNSMHQVRSMIGTLQDQRTTLKDLWVSRKGQLEQRFQFNVFMQDAEKMLSWMMESRQECMYNFSDIGDDLEIAEELREEFKQFEETCGDVQVNIDRILQVANRLREMQVFDTVLIDRLAAKLETEWNRLYTAVERRSAMLEASVSFHKSSEQYLAQSKVWIDELNLIEEKDIDNVKSYEESLKTNNELKQSMMESYEFVTSNSKHLLNCLQRTPSGDSREEKARSRLSDYTDAASHVMDVIVELYKQNKQLMILWEKQKTRIRQKYKLSQFNQECEEILRYLRGNGTSFLAKNSWVGDQLEVAEELLTDQHDFEATFQETYIKAKKLLESAQQLAESKECEPQEIKLKASNLEQEVKSFTSKLKKRRELLKMAVSFYKNVQKLSKVSEKLKDELNLDSVGGSEPQNFDVQLESHRLECESTLERLLCTVHEGEQLSAELLQECKSTTGKDSRTSWFSAGANSVEQSKLAVELYLKDLNHNRQQLEKMWRGRQQKLDHWVQVKHYERDSNILYADTIKWSTSWMKKELSCDINKALNMVERFENEYNDISQRYHSLLLTGRDLENTLHACGVEVVITLADNHKEDSVKYIKEIVKKMQIEFENVQKVHYRLKGKYEFTIKQRKLEADAKKVSGWIRHGESILQASQEAGFSMYEAEALLREYERFHVAIETTRLGVMDIRENADKLLHDGHPDEGAIERVAGDVQNKWQLLMEHAEERRAVVFSSYNFYRAAEQVSKLLEKFSKDCKSDEDPCEKFAEYELKFRREKIEALIKKSEPERKAVEDGCLKVKECSEEFLKRVLPSGDGMTTPVIDGTIGRLEITVNDLVEQVTSQEAFVLKQIQLRKNVLSGCVEFVAFQQNVQETLKLITEQGTIVSEGFEAVEQEKEADDNENEKSSYLVKQEEYKVMFLQIRQKVKVLLKEASDLVARNHFHRNSITELATSIDTRYKDLACHMKQYRESLVNKLGCSVPEFEDGEEWPSLSALQLNLCAVTRRDVSNDSGIHEMTEEKRRSVKRIEFIINELIQTEKAYVDDLKCCIDNFLIPMYNSPDLPEALVGCEYIIFGNIEMIHEFHSNVFLGELEKYQKCADHVGKCFVEWAEKFHMYVDYCANKPDSNALLIKHGENFFEDLQMRRKLGLSLAAYLIKPVQRITKYQLLLKELLSCCDDEDGTLMAGLEVMLSVPRRANDAMYLCMIKGFDEGSLETLGKILLQDSFTVWDPKHILKKGKERHLFLFEQALLLCKEIKDVNGKCTFDYKCKLKTSEMGITEHVAEDKCKFAAWTGEPPFTEEKRIIKAESEVVKHMWVKEIRELIQQFQFGILKARTNFYPTSPRRKSSRKSPSQADISLTSTDSSILHTDRMSADYDTATICSRSSMDMASRAEAMYIATDDYAAKASNEISLRKGQSVEVLSKPPGSRSWRVRILDDELDEEAEGLVPHQVLRKIEDSPLRGKRSSIETLNSQSSEDSYQMESPKGSMQSVSGPRSPKVNRRRAKSVNIGGTLKMKTWSRGSAKKYMNGQKPPLPTTPTRNKNISGGGSKKLQAILGAPESDIDLLIRPSDGKYATLGRAPSGNAERVKFLISNEAEDAGFQEGDYDSDGDSMSDSNETFDSTMKEDQEERACVKRMSILRELIESEGDYINDLETMITKYWPAISQRDDTPEELKSQEQVIFGNLRDLLAFHKGHLMKELESCDSSPENLASVFLKSEKDFALYVNYCANKPRSASLIHDHLDTYFASITANLDLRVRLEDYLMRPVQRIMRYYSMLKDFTKYSSRGGVDINELAKALHVMQVIPKKADDVMNIGMLEGFPGNLNNQGKLLMQDTLYVANAKVQGPSLERKVFLFEKVLVFSEPLERKSNLLCYIFRHSVETNTLGLTANYDDDVTKFSVWSKRSSGSSEIYVFTAKSPSVKKCWVESIKRITEEQYFEARDRSVSTWTHQPNTSNLCNGGPVKVGKSSIDASLQHVKLIPLDEARSLEDLTKPFPVQDKFTVTESYQAQTPEQLTVHKNDTVYLVHRAKKGDEFYFVKSFAKERSGLVPASILKKSNERKNSGDKHTKSGRSASLGIDKPKKESSSKIPKMNYSATLLRTSSLKRKKDRNKRKGSGDSSTMKVNTNISPAKSAIDKLHHRWTSNVDSSEDEEAKESNDKASESLDRILSRDSKTTSEIAPEFKILPRDVTVDIASHVKLTCTVVGYPPPDITWLQNDKSELKNGGKYKMNYKNQICVLEIFSTEPTDTGKYTCKASNSLGCVSCSANVMIKGECKPGIPSKPHLVTMNATSVTLSWNPPLDINSIPVHAYSVQYRERTSPDWLVAIPVCNGTTALIDELVTGNVYMFRVSANNDIGMGENSEPSDPIEVSGETDSPRPHEIRWRENIEEYYNICGELGRGRFSIVKRCVEKKSNKEYAAKIVRRRMLSKEAVESEVAILQALDHPSIVYVHEIYDAPKGLVIVEQLLAGGRLFDYIVIMDMLTEEIAIRFIKQLLIALHYLHAKSIAHLDIKPENILLTAGDEPRVVLSDFGEAIRLGSVPYQHELTGNPEFSAPEVVSNDTVSLATDMWSVGVLVYVLLSGVSPFYSDNLERACTNVTEIRYNFPVDFFADISDEAQDFVEELLIRDQAHRPNAEECLGFSWIRMSDTHRNIPSLKKRISLSRLAAFNARRRYQYESTNQNSSISTSQLLSPEKKSSVGHRR